jgi:hypothetical protein
MGMSAHHQSLGPRSNAYSGSKFTNWALYDPFFAEARTALKRFDRRLPAQPALPRLIVLPPLQPDFIHICNREQVERRLTRMQPKHLVGLRAVFLLSGTRKQQRCWTSSLYCYGMYWSSCVFLCAYLFSDARNQYIDDLRDFYLDYVLVHEVAHHVDRRLFADHDTREGFAHAFVQRKCA